MFSFLWNSFAVVGVVTIGYWAVRLGLWGAALTLAASLAKKVK